jgi:hypothetical protein
MELAAKILTDHMDFTSGDDDDDDADDDDDDDEKQKTIFHFTYINNLSRLISKQVGNVKKKKCFCERCLNRFLNEGVLKKHLDDCKVLNETKMILPNENNKIMKFTNFKNKIQVPFAIYADIESILLNYNDNKNISKTEIYQIHKPFCIAYYLNCSYGNSISKFNTFTGKDCIVWFVPRTCKNCKTIKFNFFKYCPIKSFIL